MRKRIANLQPLVSGKIAKATEREYTTPRLRRNSLGDKCETGLIYFESKIKPPALLGGSSMAKRKSKTTDGFLLRPGVTNPELWYPERPPKAEWERIRRVVLERDNHTCRGCGHRALKYMNVHHLEETGENTPENLTTLCVACHAVLHIGRNLDLQVIEIWEAALSQVEIVQRTREGIRAGLSLEHINKDFKLKPGPYPPNSTQYANDLVQKMKKAPRAYLDEPLCAVFVNLKRWQLE